ncbi:OPT family small oligopeptide transporter [Helicostylum pulchrum]|uniref:OPT family small oligopeptide transporter n=1 Tax=Helicostylum pulchrum TaxID=562976 RepID=A0ABP9YHI6_9FUNG|nr:OPT family small oligopeptide transporter [Helicostylum pulchrum]
MTGTSLSSVKKEGLINEYITAETIVSSEKLEDFVSDREKTQHIDDSEKSDFNEFVETAEDSPIEEVRAVVSNTDDPTLPVYTFRMWFLGIIFGALLSFVNQFFHFRQNALTLSPLVVQLLSFPIGKLMEKVIPKSKFFNPGPFNIKEHVLITTLANCCYSTAYAVDIITIQRIFYNQNLGWGGGILLIWTTQFIGYGMAGLLRPYLVYPSAMVWPGNLSNISLFRSFHQPDSNWSGPTRLRWFMYSFAGMFVYYWLPGYFFQVLTFFSWACWINQDNRVLAQLTGSLNGLGMLSVSFDWTTITSFLGSPLVVPFWAIANISVGFVFVAWIMVPALYYSNVWDAKTFPILTSDLFNVAGEPWDNSLVLNDQKILDPALYAIHGPLRMTTFFAFTYGIGFAGVTSLLTHTALFHGKDIIKQFKNSRTKNNEDIHQKLMRAYPEVPDWWYIAIFFVSFGVSFAVIYEWPIYLPWWGLILAVAISVIFVLPIGIIQAVTNQQPGLNVITEFVIGFALPGHPIANVTFKTYGYISSTQCLNFLSDLKLGHYTKVPPKAMFWVQIVGTFLAGLVNLATATWLMDTVADICTTKGRPFTCPSARTFYSASVIWGAIGPEKMFGAESPYNSMLWFFLIGVFIPIPFWLLSKKYPNSWIKFIHIPLILNSTGMMPPAVPLNFSMWCAAGFVFMFYIRRYHFEWWRKYNYVTSAAFDSGVAISAIIVFGVVTGSGYTPEWWGNGGAGGPNAMGDNCNLAADNYYGYCPSC